MVVREKLLMKKIKKREEKKRELSKKNKPQQSNGKNKKQIRMVFFSFNPSPPFQKPMTSRWKK